METLKVGTKSNPNSVAGALANVFREKGSVEIQAIGAGALNQAIKAIAIARGFIAPSGKNLKNLLFIILYAKKDSLYKLSFYSTSIPFLNNLSPII